MAYHNGQFIYEHIFSPSSEYFQKYAITIVPGTALTTVGRIIQGIGANYPTINLGASYTGSLARYQKMIASVGSTYRDWYNEVAKAVNSLTGKKAMDAYGETSVADTLSVYSNSPKPSISFSIILFREFDPQMDEKIKNAISYLAPDQIEDCLIRAPGRYTIKGMCKGGVDPSLTYMISVGEWFNATLLIPVNLNITNSSQLQFGKPMYTTLDFTFEAARILESKEIENWFV